MFKRISLFFAWYDLWVGFFYDRKKELLYFCPVPMVVFQIDCHTGFSYKQLKLYKELADALWDEFRVKLYPHVEFDEGYYEYNLYLADQSLYTQRKFKDFLSQQPAYYKLHEMNIYVIITSQDHLKKIARQQDWKYYG